MQVTEALPIAYLLKWCLGLFFTMLPSVAFMWAIIEKSVLAIGLNLFLVIQGVLMANTPIWVVYPYCYSGYLVSCSLHEFTVESDSLMFELFPFLPCALFLFIVGITVAVTRFGRKEMI